MAFHSLKVVRKEKINVVLTGETEALPFLSCKRGGAKIIIRGGNPFPEATKLEFKHYNKKFEGITLKLIDLYEKIILQHTDKIVILSSWEEKILRKYTKKKMYMIRYAVDTNNFKLIKRKNRNKLLYIGRINPTKRIDSLIKMFDGLRKKMMCTLTLVGELDGYENIEELIGKSKFKKDIIYLGEKKAEDIPKILGEHDIFVHAAFDLGNAPLEAAATGLDVVVLGNKFDEKYITQVNSVDDFVSKVFCTLCKTKKNHLQQRKLVEEEHSWDSITKQYIKLFQQTILS